MRAEDAVYGGEMSAHHYFRDFHYCDSGMIPWLLVGQLLVDSKSSLASLVTERISMFPCSGEVNFTVQDIPSMIQKVTDFYNGLDPVFDRTDGVSMNFEDWRLNIRASNTEPLMRVNIESKNSKGLVDRRLKELTDLISENLQNT